MAKSTVDVKGIEATLKAGDIFLLGGKKQIVVDGYDAKKGGVTIDFRKVGKEGKLSTKSASLEVTEPTELLPLKGKIVSTVSISEKALDRAMKAYAKGNGKTSRSAKVDKSTKTGKSVKADKPAKVYAVLKKEKKVVSAKVLKETSSGKKCEFRFEGEKISRSIKDEFIFDDRSEAKAALKELKGGKSTKAVTKSSEKKAASKKEPKTSEAKAGSKKVYVILKSANKVVSGKFVKETANGAKTKVIFRDPEQEEKVTRSFKNELVFEDRPEAKAALKALKNGKKDSGKAKKEEKAKSGKAAKAAKEELTCSDCKKFNKKKNDCEHYNGTHANDPICDDGFFVAK